MRWVRAKLGWAMKIIPEGKMNSSGNITTEMINEKTNIIKAINMYFLLWTLLCPPSNCIC